MPAAAAADAADCTMVLLEDSNTGSSDLAKRSSSRAGNGDGTGALYADHGAVVTFADAAAPASDQDPKQQQQQQQQPQQCEGCEDDPLLAGAVANINSTSASNRSGAEDSGGSSSMPADDGSSRQPGRWRQAVKGWCIVLGIGSIAGTLSGIMEGLTGKGRGFLRETILHFYF
jgi:hypothetical protein